MNSAKTIVNQSNALRFFLAFFLPVGIQIFCLIFLRSWRIDIGSAGLEKNNRSGLVCSHTHPNADPTFYLSELCY